MLDYINNIIINVRKVCGIKCFCLVLGQHSCFRNVGAFGCYDGDGSCAVDAGTDCFKCFLCRSSGVGVVDCNSGQFFQNAVRYEDSPPATLEQALEVLKMPKNAVRIRYQFLQS